MLTQLGEAVWGILDNDSAPEILWFAKTPADSEINNIASGVTQNQPTVKSRTLTPRGVFVGSLGMSNVLSEKKNNKSSHLEGSLGCARADSKLALDALPESA